MTLLVEKGTFTKTTSTSTPVDQTVTLSNGSLTPKLVILWTTGQTTNDGTYVNDARMSYGFSDGTTDACQALRSDESAELESYTFRTDSAICIINLTTNAIVSQGDISAFNAGNFHINWSVQSDTSAMVIHYIVAGGTDITNVSVVNTTVGDTSTGNHSYNGSGTTFTPDFALCMTGTDDAAGTDTLASSGDDALFCIGAAKSTSARWVIWGRVETIGTSDTDMYINPSACLAACSQTAGTITFLADFVSFNSAAGGGITVNISDGATSASQRLAFLLVKGGTWDCGAFQQRNGTGTQDVTIATGLNPEIVFLGGINSATSGSVVVNNYIGIGASDGTNEGASYFGSTNALATWADVNSNLNTKVYRISTPNATASSSTTNAECDMTGMSTAGQFTLDWTTADSTLRQMVYWTLGTITSTAFDRAPATETVTISDTIARSYGTARQPGKRPSLLFNGSNDYLNCGNHGDLWSQSLTKFSFAFWWYPTQNINGELISHNGAAGGFKCFQNFGDISFEVNSGGAVSVFGSRGNLNTWKHVICTMDSTLGSNEMKIFIDNVLLAENHNVSAINLSLELLIGKAGAGNIKDFRWWTTIALDSTQRTDVFNNETDAPTPDYWLKMEEGTSTPVDTIASRTTTFNLGTDTVWAIESPGMWREINVISDSVSRMVSAIRNPIETTTLSETIARMLTLLRPIDAETTVIADAVVREKGIPRSMTETVDISESIVRMLAATRNPVEDTTVSDSVTRLLAANRSLATETAAMTDQVQRVVGNVRAIATETVTSSDSVQRLLAASVVSLKSQKPALVEYVPFFK